MPPPPYPVSPLPGADVLEEGHDPAARPGARIRYDGNDHRNLSISLNSQRRLGSTHNLKLRRFTDTANWTNPNGAPGRLSLSQPGLDRTMLVSRQPMPISGQRSRLFDLPPTSINPTTSQNDADGGYLTQMARTQARAMLAIQDKISQSALGRRLLDSAREGHVVYGFRIIPGDLKTVAGYDHRQRQVVFGTESDMAQEQDPRRFLAMGAFSGAHELTHGAQDRHVRGDFVALDPLVSLRDRMLSLRHLEAAATAGSIQVAWEARQAGDDSLWQVASDEKEDPKSARAFAEAVARDPAAAHDGRARRAAHDAWFSETRRMSSYDEGVVLEFRRNLEQLAAQQQAGWPDADARTTGSLVGAVQLETSDFEDATAMPDGIQHMDLPGLPGPRDQHYRALPNPRVAEQMAWLEKLAERIRQDQPVSQADIDHVDAIGARYRGTDFAPQDDVAALSEMSAEPDQNPLRIRNRHRKKPDSPPGDNTGNLARWRQQRQKSHQKPGYVGLTR